MQLRAVWRSYIYPAANRLKAGLSPAFTTTPSMRARANNRSDEKQINLLFINLHYGKDLAERVRKYLDKIQGGNLYRENQIKHCGSKSARLPH